MVKKSIINSIKKFIKALKQEGIKINKVILYGSYATAKPRPESDIDVAIVSENFGKDRTEEGMFLFRIAGSIDPRIEPLPISLKSYKEDTWLPLIYEIKKRGIKLKVA